MENLIKETTEKLTNGTITKDEADKILLGLFSVMPRMVVFYINYPKGVGVVEKKRMPITHPDLENEIYIYEHILPKTDDYMPYWQYEA